MLIAPNLSVWYLRNAPSASQPLFAYHSTSSFKVPSTFMPLLIHTTSLITCSASRQKVATSASSWNHTSFLFFSSIARASSDLPSFRQQINRSYSTLFSKLKVTRSPRFLALAKASLSPNCSVILLAAMTYLSRKSILLRSWSQIKYTFSFISSGAMLTLFRLSGNACGRSKTNSLKRR